MAIPADVLRAMRAAGASAEAIIAAIEADQAIDAQRVADRRAKAAAKKRRQRAEVELRSFDVPGTLGDIEGHEGTNRDNEGQVGTTEDVVAVVGKEGPQTPKETTNQEITPSAPKGASVPKGTDRRRGTRIPDGFEHTPEARQAAADFGFVGDEADEVLAEFADYWRPLPGLKATKLDWLGTLRNRLREVARRRHPPRGPGGGGSQPPPKRRTSNGFFDLIREDDFGGRDEQHSASQRSHLRIAAGGRH